MTLSTTQFRPGAVVRINLTFTEGLGAKRRPAVVLTDRAYHDSRSDAIIVALSTQQNSYHGDCEINDWRLAGLQLPTKAKGVIQTIARSSVDYQYGTLSDSDWGRVKDSIRTILGLHGS